MKCALLFALLLAIPARTLPAQARTWRADERVLITSFALVGALARDTRQLYIASPGGLAVYDFTVRRWHLPITMEDGYPPWEQPTAAAYEPMGAEVWIGTATGSVLRWRSTTLRLETVAFGLGRVSAIVADLPRDDNVYIRSATGWLRARKTSFGVQLISATEVPPEVVRRASAASTLDPALNAFRASLGLDRSGRRWPLNALVSGETRDSFWFGTQGGFVFQFDPLRQNSEWLWYGSVSRGVAAVALQGTDIWFGGDGRGPRNGVVRATADLQQWSAYESLSGAPAGRVNDIALLGTSAYFAARDGVYQLTQGRWRRHSDEEAFALATDGRSVFAATRNGVSLLGDGAPGFIARSRDVQRVRMVRDSLWIIGARAIVTHRPGDSTWTALNTAAIPNARLVDAAAQEQDTWLLSQDALYLLAAAGVTPRRIPLPNELGRPRSMELVEATLWIAGERGVAGFAPETGRWQILRVPEDIPEGPVFDIARAGPDLWIATPAGALRLRWRS